MTRANKPAPSSIRRSRMTRWAEFDAMTPAERIEAGIATVYSTGRSERGYAGWPVSPSCRCGSPGATGLRVIWSDGAMTLCCTRGMESSGGEDERMPGGYAEWTIR